MSDLPDRRPIIGITCGETSNVALPWTSKHFSQSQSYCKAIVRAGGLPIILPIIEQSTVLRQLYDRCDGILLAGGDDIDPSRYQQLPHPATVVSSPQQDKQDFQLAAWAIADDKALLGICRGMQLLNVQLGGTLYQHIPEALPAALNHEASALHQDTGAIAHRLQIRADSRLAEIFQATTIDANSQHHQAVDTLGDGLIVSAEAEDGIIEAIELPGKNFVVAVQPHPEGLEAVVETEWRRLFTEFVKVAATKMPAASS